MESTTPADPASAVEPAGPTAGPLARAAFLLLTGMLLGLFLGAALFSDGAPNSRWSEQRRTGVVQPRALATGKEARALPPGHPPVEGYAPESDASGCPYLDGDDSESGAEYQREDAQPSPRARPLRAAPQSEQDGPI